MVTSSKGRVDLSLGASFTMSAPCLVLCSYIFCRWRYVLFFCHMTSKYHSIDVLCKFMGGSSLPYVTTLTSLVTITILIVKEETCFIRNMNLINMYSHWKNWIYWINTRHEKNVTTSKMYILKKSAKKVKRYCFSPYNYLL